MFRLILILSIFVPTLPNKEQTSQTGLGHSIARDYASIILDENQRFYNHSLPNLSNDFFKVENTIVLVICGCFEL